MLLDFGYDLCCNGGDRLLVFRFMYMQFGVGSERELKHTRRGPWVAMSLYFVPAA